MGKKRLYLEQQNAKNKGLFFSIRKKSEPLGERFKKTLHWHDYFEIELIVDGIGTHLLNGKSYELRRGCIYLLTPKDFHSVTESNENPLSLYNINFNEQLLPIALQKRLVDTTTGLCLYLDDTETQNMCHLAERLIFESNGEEWSQREMIRALFTQFIILLLRKSQQTPTPHAKEEKSLSQVGWVISYLKSHFRESVTLSDCARMVYLTPNYLGELFHKETGIRFQQYLRRLRFEYALNLLRVSETTVEEISIQSGFSSSSHFSHLFHEEYGMTPTQYRAMQRQDTVREE